MLQKIFKYRQFQHRYCKKKRSFNKTWFSVFWFMIFISPHKAYSSKNLFFVFAKQKNHALLRFDYVDKRHEENVEKVGKEFEKWNERLKNIESANLGENKKNLQYLNDLTAKQGEELKKLSERLNDYLKKSQEMETKYEALKQEHELQKKGDETRQRENDLQKRENELQKHEIASLREQIKQGSVWNDRVQDLEKKVQEKHNRIIAIEENHVLFLLQDNKRGHNIQERLKQVDQIASHVSLAGADFQKADLNGQDFSGQDLSGAKFIQCKCVGTNFKDTKLEGAIFSDSDLTNSVLTNANLKNCRFESTIFKGTHLENANFSHSSIKSMITIFSMSPRNPTSHFTLYYLYI
ncbi:Pentapeptide repeat protein [Reticulomyxa filosa]|uniref:Pentapeptide repeat protein n=1 Tax=Reticulomyxa filosa TaxID=46433 RepID=X6MHK1_RETFI|nr:Pentapeptide repeat protein [Reticulomyxa filosa]|eukprot:ETO13483.1 Pentapeptide repeat protein [Reticulomyxa filosa]